MGNKRVRLLSCHEAECHRVERFPCRCRTRGRWPALWDWDCTCGRSVRAAWRTCSWGCCGRGKPSRRRCSSSPAQRPPPPADSRWSRWTDSGGARWPRTDRSATAWERDGCQSRSSCKSNLLMRDWWTRRTTGRWTQTFGSARSPLNLTTMMTSCLLSNSYAQLSDRRFRRVPWTVASRWRPSSLHFVPNTPTVNWMDDFPFTQYHNFCEKWFFFNLQQFLFLLFNFFIFFCLFLEIRIFFVLWLVSHCTSNFRVYCCRTLGLTNSSRLWW